MNHLRILEQNSMDFYASVRSLYLQDRKQKNWKFQKKLSILMDDGDWEEIESQINTHNLCMSLKKFLIKFSLILIVLFCINRKIFFIRT